MGSVYQLTFLLALGLLAIVITIFVFAVSLLGRAIEAAAISEKENLAQRKENNTKEMAAIRKKIEEAETSGQIPKGLTRELDKLEKKNKKFEKELGKIRKAPALLTARGGVFYPCASLIAALALNAGALYLSDIENIHWAKPLSIWILGLAAIGFSIYRICKSLNVIQNVAITSEEAWIKKTVDAFKIAQKELEEEKKLIVELVFPEEQPPFHMTANSTKIIVFALSLVRGVECTSPHVLFLAPPGFDFPGHTTFKQSNSSSNPNYISTYIEVSDIHRRIRSLSQITLKAPAESKTFTILYSITGTDYASDELEFQLIVD